MPAKPLTAAAVARLRPGAKRRIFKDGTSPSLYLVVQPSGHRSWLMRFRRPGGKPGKLVLGPVADSGEVTGDPVIGMPLTLKAARLLAAKVHRDRERGVDVVAQHKSRKHRVRAEQESRTANSFPVAARKFIDEHARPQTRRWRETARLLGYVYAPGQEEPELAPNGLAQRWADRAVRDIDSHEIWSVIDEARKVAVPGLPTRNSGVSETRARAFFTALSSMFGWLHRHRQIESNSCTGLHRPTAPEPRERVLSDSELKWFWLACDKLGPPFGPMLQLLLLTGQRLREVAGMRHDELRDDDWHLPGTRTKNHRPHVVPLTASARELIDRVPQIANSPFIFSTTGNTAVSGFSRTKKTLDTAMLAVAQQDNAKATIPPWRIHDLRRSAVTGMAELGIPPHVVELVVNHISGARGGIAGVYNKSELLPERRAALERWATHLRGIVEGKGNVIDLPTRRR